MVAIVTLCLLPSSCPPPTLHHRLGIILEVKLSIVKNLPVRRTKQDIKPPEFVSDIQTLSSRYSEAVKSNSQYSLSVWEAMKDWSETQVGHRHLLVQQVTYLPGVPSGRSNRSKRTSSTNRVACSNASHGVTPSTGLFGARPW